MFKKIFFSICIFIFSMSLGVCELVKEDEYWVYLKEENPSPAITYISFLKTINYGNKIHWKISKIEDTQITYVVGVSTTAFTNAWANKETITYYPPYEVYQNEITS